MLELRKRNHLRVNPGRMISLLLCLQQIQLKHPKRIRIRNESKQEEIAVFWKGNIKTQSILLILIKWVVATTPRTSAGESSRPRELFKWNPNILRIRHQQVKSRLPDLDKMVPNSEKRFLFYCDQLHMCYNLRIRGGVCNPVLVSPSITFLNWGVI